MPILKNPFVLLLLFLRLCVLLGHYKYLMPSNLQDNLFYLNTKKVFSLN
jgi:hypothetical protein